jgi:ornithine decarboxylase
MDSVLSTLELVRRHAPEDPVAIARPQQVGVAARYFLDRFPGQIFYAVKANPAPWALDALWEAGVRAFDVASDAEVRLIAERFPEAKMAFMHPVKSRGAIRRAYANYGVKTFAIDTIDELEKVLEETGQAKDLHLVVRLAAPSDYAQHKLDKKFGAEGDEAVELMRAVRAKADEMGVSFHVGSQCMRPEAYRVAMEMAGDLIRRAGVFVDIVDVGGGFPSIYEDGAPPPLAEYMAVIKQAFEDMPVLENAELWAEPGRSLVAEGGSHLVKVELRKGDTLYVNDGSYGALFDAAHCGVKFPVRLVRGEGEASETLRAFDLYGPTCDSIDHMKGPFLLPEDIREGDYIEIGMTGAYGAALATSFNGFGQAETVVAHDAPMATMYAEQPARVVRLTRKKKR